MLKTQWDGKTQNTLSKKKKKPKTQNQTNKQTKHPLATQHAVECWWFTLLMAGWRGPAAATAVQQQEKIKIQK